MLCHPSIYPDNSFCIINPLFSIASMLLYFISYFIPPIHNFLTLWSAKCQARAEVLNLKEWGCDNVVPSQGYAHLKGQWQMNMEQWWLAGKTEEAWSKACSSATLSTINERRSYLGSTLGLCSEKPTCNCLSYDTVIICKHLNQKVQEVNFSNKHQLYCCCNCKHRQHCWYFEW